jgi:DNA (cytosine-5)-methyltransferase 1
MPDGRIIKPDIRDAERLQGFDVNWTASSSQRQRWSLVGNAVTVPVATWLGQRLMRPGSYTSDRDRPWLTKAAFPQAARYDGRKRLIVESGGFPVWMTRSPLHRFLKYEGTLLSVRATSGFLTRAEASRLRFMPGFLDAVRTHLDRMRQDETVKTILAYKSEASVMIAAE